jgi:predicted Rossmann fold flavoprotein
MYDVIVIGSGPAGIMASIKAAENKKSVLLLEKNDSIGKKLKLTGGTRCNLTNLKTTSDFINQIPVNNKTLYSCLSQFGPQDIYNYFESIGVKLKVEDHDRVFPQSNKAETIIDALYNELIKNKVNIHFNESVEDININNDIKEITTNKDTYQAKNIIVATGGKSYPHTGSTGDGYKLSKMLNQPLTKLYPAETFLIANNEYPLAGITLDNVEVSINKRTVDGSLLFTHVGVSGPAIFKISEEVYKNLEANNQASIKIDLLPQYTVDKMMSLLNNYNQKKNIGSFFKEYLPKRLAEYLITDGERMIVTISKVDKMKLMQLVKGFEIDIKQTGTIEQSFVTGGGVDIKYINPKTMESTINKGIYFVGEVLDIHGHTGGYNITIALSTGYAAGVSI